MTSNISTDNSRHCPKVSVCIPTFNSARYLPDAIESVLAQDFSDYEVVICDNASTDGTTELCRRYLDKRIRYVRFDEFVGQAANWNRCLSLAAGEYVILLHADDLLRPSFLRLASGMLDDNSAVNLVHCTVERIDQSGASLRLQQLYDEDRVEAGDILVRRLLLEGCVVSPAGVLVRRSAYRSAGAFTEQILWGVDWHMWIRLALEGDVGYLAKTLALYREHPQSGTSGVMATARNGTEELWMMNDVFGLIPPSRTDLLALRSEAIRNVAHRTWCFAEEMCRLGFLKPARAGIRRAVLIRPAMLLSARVWALWAATFLGYEWFRRVHESKRGLAGSRQA